MKIEKTQQNTLKIIIAFLVVVVAFSVFYYLYYMTDIIRKKDEKKSAKVVECGPLVPEKGSSNEGKSPFVPKLQAKITGEYNSKFPVCVWKVNGINSGITVPKNGYCTLSGQELLSVGTYDISYNVVGLSDCPKSIKIIVK